MPFPPLSLIAVLRPAPPATEGDAIQGAAVGTVAAAATVATVAALEEEPPPAAEGGAEG